MNFIDNIRQKPQAVKLKIIWTLAGLITIALILIWIISVKINNRYGSLTNIFANMHKKFNSEQQSYQEDLNKQGVTIPNKLNIH